MWWRFAAWRASKAADDRVWRGPTKDESALLGGAAAELKAGLMGEAVLVGVRR